MADAYKLKADASFPEVIRTAMNVNGFEVNETQGKTYGAGEYVLATSLTPGDQERAENGELDHLLEPADLDEAQAALSFVNVGTFIPEHEVERYVLLDGGHKVIEKDQVLELRSAGAEAAAAAFEASGAGNPNRPQITEQPSFVEVSSTSGDDPVLPVTPSEPVSDAEIVEKGVEMPPGIPVGPTLAKAEGADASEVDAKVAESKPARKRPGRAKPVDKPAENAS